MTRCPRCDTSLPDSAKFCPECGTAILEVGATRETGGRAHPPSSAPIDLSRFAPGKTLADRYRIVALIGQGGMGEVYRAEDLKLGQTVALKFLPDQLAKDGAALARFHREVRVARQVSHPNVCRVFDIGDADGM